MSSLKSQRLVISRRDFISGPYKKCPDPSCSADGTFGVFTCFANSVSYTRECIKCGYSESYKLPEVKKKIVYLDQFVISNLLKLLDREHRSHEKNAVEPFWSKLFEKIDLAIKYQAIICPDSLYHVNESLVGIDNFELMKRLYEHLSCGKTFYYSTDIEHRQILHHFEKWIVGQKHRYDLGANNICHDDLNAWAIGLMIGVNVFPFKGQIESIKSSNSTAENQLQSIWGRWKDEKHVKFIERVHEETLGLGKGLIEVLKIHAIKYEACIRNIQAGAAYDVDDLFPPTAKALFEDLFRSANKHTGDMQKAGLRVREYFNNVSSLLEIPSVKINSVMFAGLAHRAACGKKSPPKSTVDIQFISSYLPYCDALFIDRESENLLREFPKNTPDNLRLKEFSARLFSMRNKEEFLDYLDKLIQNVPKERMRVIKDILGDRYDKPYWSIIEREKKR